MLRVICTSIEHNKKSETVKWEGRCIRDLSRKYPPSNIYGVDPLGYQEWDGGDLRYSYHFEQQTDENWKEIPDPRIRLQRGMTHAEREIDRENRRLFPGDYLEE